MRFLLDTNIISNLIHHPHGHVARRVGRVGQDRVCTSIIVAAELRYGAAKKASTRLSADLEAVLGSLAILEFKTPSDKIYGELRAALERSGQLIGPYDLLIAAQTLALGGTLVTDNEREFSRIPGLALENWLR